ncbi:MAG: restriction endonuclease, SacI family [Terriglobia bacterium]
MPKKRAYRQIKPKDALKLLAEVFLQSEGNYRDGSPIDLPAEVVAATERLFISETQAYREALIGCVVARVLDPQTDIRLPATKYGEAAFSGRILADQAITPFLRERAIPISASPYLSSLRGGARFVQGGQPRIQRDQGGFDALVAVVDFVSGLDSGAAKGYLCYLLRRFIQLREASNIALRKIARPNLEQLTRLISGLIIIKSGGRIPAMLATAMFQTINECYNLGWDVDFQGINVADKASGAVGDIAIKKHGVVLIGVEVTERTVDQGRVTLIFDQKVSPSGLNDYLFVTTTTPDAGANEAARNYTGVGHEMNFVDLEPWLRNNLATIGQPCRAIFQSKMIDLLTKQGVPADLRVAWNSKMDSAIAGSDPATHF